MKRAFTLLLLFSVLGLIASIAMTKLHYQLGAKGFEEKSFCNVSEFIDCDTALASRYSQIRTRWITIPTAELGVIYYLFLSVFVIYAWVSGEKRRGILSFLFIAAGLAFLHSLALAYISITKLIVICLLCLTTYVSNFFIWLFLPRAMGVPWRAAPKLPFQYLRSLSAPSENKPKPGFVFMVGMVSVFLVFGLLFFKGLNAQVHRGYVEVPREAYLKAFYALPQKSFNVSKKSLWGNPNASVTIVEFSDFQCPFCRRAAFTLKPYLKEFKNDVRLAFVNYPLDSACNTDVTRAMHPVACLAAKASICAAQEGKFWDYHDRIFENQKKLSRETLLKLAEQDGLDRGRFEQCLIADATETFLKEDVEAGHNAEITGTPAVFVNGRPFRDWMNQERLRMVIEAEIQKSIK